MRRHAASSLSVRPQRRGLRERARLNGRLAMNGMDASTGAALSGDAHLGQSIGDILSTPIGTRVMRRDYGSALFDLIDAPFNAATRLRMGINLPAAMKAATSAGKSPIEAIAELTQKATGGDMTKLGALFEDVQASSALRTILQNIDYYREVRNSALHAQGTVEVQFQNRMKDADAQARKLRASTEALANTVGANLLPYVTAAGAKLSAWAEKATALAQAHPKLTGGIAGTVAAGAALLVTLGAMGLIGGQVVKGWGYLVFAAQKLRILSILPGLFGLVRTAMLFLARGVLQAGAMMLANPVVLIFVAIAAAIGVAAYLIYKHWDTIKGAFRSALAYVSGLWTQFKAAGEHLIDGLTGGILSKIAAIKNTITGLADKVVGWFRAKLGIRSPSRVFAGLGGFLTAGLAQGLDRGADRPIRAMSRIAARVTTAAAAAIAPMAPVTAITPISPIAARAPVNSTATATRPAGAAPAPQTHYEIHIHAQPGEDARAIANAVTRELDRREQRKQAARRSSYRDDA